MISKHHKLLHSWKAIGCIVLSLAAGIAFCMWKLGSTSSATAAETSTQNSMRNAKKESTAATVPVVLRPVEIRTFERRIEVQGNVEAKNTAMVSPRIPGVIEALYVDEGDVVIAGQTKVLATDSLKIQKNVQIQEHGVAVARCAHREAVANLERAQADFDKAEMDFRRFERLVEKKAVTLDGFEQQQSRFRQTQAMLRLAEAQVDLTVERQKESEAALAIARKDLSDAVVLAPIHGTISMKLQEPGEMGQPGAPVFRIEDLSLVEISAMIPANYYPQIEADKTPMRVVVSDVEVGTLAISYKSPTIQSRMRTFEIKARMKNPPAVVVPGAMANITVTLSSRKSLGVPTIAIQKRADRDVVFVIRNGRAAVVEVTPGIENDGFTEVAPSILTESDSVVTMGQYLLNQDTPVVVQQEGK